MRRASNLLARVFRGCARHRYDGGSISVTWTSTRNHQQNASIGGVSAPSPSQLDQVVRLEELLKKTREEVVDIWMQYHSDANGGRVGSVLGSHEYDTFLGHAKESPMFVLPLLKPVGYEMLMVQCQMPYVLVTGLEEFKRNGAGASPYLTLTHYPELRDSHGLVLVRGDVIHNKGINVQEARATTELLRAFYIGSEDYPLVYTFNHMPTQFDIGALLRRCNIPA